jgi:hypothetical protein
MKIRVTPHGVSFLNVKTVLWLDDDAIDEEISDVEIVLLNGREIKLNFQESQQPEELN